MGTWQHKEFEKCLTKVTYTNKIQQFDFKESGKYPIISQNAEFISGYWDNDKDVFKLSKPVVIFGDHTRCLKYIDFDFVLGADGVKILQTIDEILPKYLYYYLQYIPIDNLGYSRHYKLLKEKIIKYPTIEQQQKIVEILDKADEIRTKKRLANDKLDEFLKSTFISMFGTVTNNKNNLPIMTIGECIDFNPSKPVLNDNCIVTFLGMKDISECGKVCLEDEKEYKDVKTGFTNFINDDVILAKITPCFENGKSAIVRNLKNGYGFGSTEFHVLRTKKDLLLPECLYQTIHSNSFIKAGTMKMSGAVGQKRVPKAFVQSYKIVVPPIEDQNKFAQIVEHVEAQKQKNELVIEQMNNLFNSLSQRAFKGEL